MSQLPVLRTLNLARYYFLAVSRNLGSKELFDDVQTYVLFVGHGRSGHSILGALLDAHPDIILPDEVDTLQYVSAGFSRTRIFQVLTMMSKKQARLQRTKFGLDGKTYSYYVPNQWQGRFRALKFIGDSKAGVTVRQIGSDPGLLKRLRDTVKVPIKIIHVVRNPFDNIATMMLRNNLRLSVTIENYFNNNCEALVSIRQIIDPDQLLLVRHEDMIASPKETLRTVVRFVGAEDTEEYLDAASNIVYTSPSKTRTKVEWEEASISAVEKYIQNYDFLSGYSFEH